MKVAIVQDWLMVYGGAERVLEQIRSCFPDADIYCLFEYVPEGQRAFLKGWDLRLSFMQKLPFMRTKYKSYFPLMPLAIEQFDLSGYDVVISCTHAIAKGVLVGPDQLHICYVHSPIRWAWDLQPQYLEESGLTRGPKSWIARWLLHKLRIWDARTAASVDAFIANSNFIARRILKCYRREATVIYPPVDVENYSYREQKEDFYVTASRMVPYKKIPVIIEAFANLPDKKLVVIGEGSEFEKCKELAGPNVTLLGFQPTEILKDYLQRAKAFIFAAEEDFGITPVEAQACGTPVIAYGKGGALETVRGLEGDPQRSGLFFTEQTGQAIAEAVRLFEAESNGILPANCRKNALRFGQKRFRTRFRTFVEHAWDDWQRNMAEANAAQLATDAPLAASSLLSRS